ncbi:hypothetical protein ACFOSV_05250 [Algoriphagus namhaensis]|uniref:Uncharacterized protein n=1 Tax=Algoriphagus namhaensis TaxID=915353 RepID=A0ABV8ARW5_9BACT
MIKFFRKIRYDLMEKNNAGKYLKYAFGEIVLVVIGILIAIWINGTYNDYKDIKVETTILQKLIADIEADYEHIVEIEDYYSRHLKNLQGAKYAFFKNNNDSIIKYIKRGYSGAQLQDINPRTSTYDEMINSGKLYNLSNENLTDLCIDYYEMLEENTYEIRQSRVEYRNINFSSEMNEYWLLYLDIRESDQNVDDLLESFVADKNSTAYKTMKQSTGYGEMLINDFSKNLTEIKEANLNLQEKLKKEVATKK